MKIQQDICRGCADCQPYCPLEGVIAVAQSSHRASPTVTLDEDRCCDCGNCLRWAGCSTGALQESEDSCRFPREVRRLFSDPSRTHASTGVPGRGTEECKTNDVTGRVGPGQAGVLVELGRPGQGTRLQTVEEVMCSLAEIGHLVVQDNPVRDLVARPDSGRLRDGLSQQVVLSIILEYRVQLEQLSDILAVIRSLAGGDMVFSLSVIYQDLPGQRRQIESALGEHGFSLDSAAKVNFGLGRTPTEEP